MNTLKRFAAAVGVALLPVLLFTFGSLVSTYQVLGSPDPLKEAISKSGLYDVAVKEALGTALQDSSGTASDAAIKQPEVQAVIDDALPPDFLQQKTEGVVDNAYGWLQGDTENLNFAVDLSEAKTRIADGMAAYAEQRLSTLPVCAAADTTALTNPLEATCVPPNFDKSLAAQQVRDEIANNQDFLKDSTLTADNLKNSDGKTIDQQLHAVPAVYEQVKWGMYITGVLAVLCAAAVVFCSATIRTGLKRGGIIALVVGIVSTLTAWAVGKGLDALTQKLAEPASDAQLQSKILDALQYLTQDIRNWWIAYGLILTGLGIAALVAIRFMRAANNALAQPIANEAAVPGEATLPAPAPTTLPRPTDPTQTPEQSSENYRKGPKIQ